MTGFVHVRGAREHNLKDIDLEIPRDALVVFTGISGSGKSSLAFGTLYAEAQRRYLESVAPYARRLFHQMSVPDVASIEGLPPAVALQQQRGAPTARSSVGSITTLSNLLRMLYSRAGDYPARQPHLEAEAFSPNTPMGACERCHGLGRIYDATEESMVPDRSLSIRDGAVAAWPVAWHGQNLRDMLLTLDIDIDKPWRSLPKKQRDWILFTDEQPVVPVYIGWDRDEVRRALKRKEAPSYLGNFSSARRYVLHTFATTESPRMKKRVARYLVNAECSVCRGKRLKKEALSVEFAGRDIAELSLLTIEELSRILEPYAAGSAPSWQKLRSAHPELALATQRIASDIIGRAGVIIELGLGYLSLERSTPTLSPGELQRLRLATQVRSNLFGVVYVLDEPSAGLHPADTKALMGALQRLKSFGNSIFVVEHELEVIVHADWLVDVGPEAGERGGEILYSGPLEGLKQIARSHTREFLFGAPRKASPPRRKPKGWLRLEGVTRNNVVDLDVSFPLGAMTSITGVSGSGKSSLVSGALVELASSELGHEAVRREEESPSLEEAPLTAARGRIAGGMESIKRLVRVDQKPIGRTPRSNIATYTGLFDHVRALFASTKQAKRRRYDAGRFSFNVGKGRCEVCEGEGFVFVELLFLPGVYAPCQACGGTRYNSETLEIEFEGKNIAQVLAMSVDSAASFFPEAGPIRSALEILRRVGLGYLKLGQSATELSGGEAQRVKLATELQRMHRGGTLYVLDEPTTGLHPFDVEMLLAQLDEFVEAGNTVVIVEHDMRIVAHSDWVIDLGPGAGNEGGRIIASGPPEEVARNKESRTAPYLAAFIERMNPPG